VLSFRKSALVAAADDCCRFALSDGAEGVGVRVVWSRYVKCRFKYKDQKEEAEPLLPAAVRLGEVAS